MRIYEKISDLVTRNWIVGQPKEDNDVEIRNNRIDKPGKIFQVDFKCSICGKSYSPKGHLKYFQRGSGKVEQMCDSCYQRFLDEWTVVSVDRLQFDEGYLGGGTAFGCRFKDGSIRDAGFGHYRQSTFGEIPDIFRESLKPFIEKYYKERQKELCTDFDIIDTWDESKVVVGFGDGSTYELEFKISVDKGLQYKPDDLAKLSDTQVAEVNKYIGDIPDKRKYVIRRGV